MRPRHLSEMLRDSRAGSVIIAKCIAAALTGLIAALCDPLAGAMASVVNWIDRHARRDMFPLLNSYHMPWEFFVIPLFNFAFMLGLAYVIAAWVYKPRVHRHLKAQIPRQA